MPSEHTGLVWSLFPAFPRSPLMTWYGMPGCYFLGPMVGRIFAFWARLIDVRWNVACSRNDRSSGRCLLVGFNGSLLSIVLGQDWFTLPSSSGPFSEGGLFGDRASLLGPAATSSVESGGA